MNIIGGMDDERDTNKKEDRENNNDELSILKPFYFIFPILRYQATPLGEKI